MSSGRRSAGAFARLGIVAVAVAALAVPAEAAPEDELQEAQRRADRAAVELSSAEEELARAADAVSYVEARVAKVEARVAEVRDQVRQLAIRMYVGGTAPLARLLRIADANHLVQVQQFSHVIAGTSTDALHQYRADREELREELSELERAQESHAETVENLRRRQAAAIREIDRLGQVVAAANAARAAEARVASATTAAPGGAGTTPPPPQAQPAAQAPAPAPARAGAAPPAPAPAPAPAPSGGGWVCPVQGPHAFTNDYGAPRGGGYSHQGIDILAATGTPVVANVDGVVTHRDGAISGLAYFLTGDDGNRYFGAHLDSFGASGRVSAGTVIGTVGTTGDAAGGPPHLHFEMHPGGGGPVNPYSMLTRYC